jgi:hypothetical protein
MQEQGHLIRDLMLRAPEDFPNQHTRRETHRVCVEHPRVPEPTSRQRMTIIEVSGVLDFWDHPEEDVYTDEDGEPI